ncbi:hypothetical protein [Rufibacter aurantiacus]|uniref:hypothetical protein n=1 Tax=Rufibacter aurantiacus TaxID=2817374 RepID=UPI001B3095D2|nr:hypothetical protein [Rufibacter aurantiacus]
MKRIYSVEGSTTTTGFLLQAMEGCVNIKLRFYSLFLKTAAKQKAPAIRQGFIFIQW